MNDVARRLGAKMEPVTPQSGRHSVPLLVWLPRPVGPGPDQVATRAWRAAAEELRARGYTMARAGGRPPAEGADDQLADPGLRPRRDGRERPRLWRVTAASQAR